MLHIFQLTYIYCINKLVTCKSTLEIRHLIFLFKNVTTWRQMLSVFCLIFKSFQISSNPFLVANSNQNEKKIALPSTVCQGLQENAFQVNQLFNVTWSIIQQHAQRQQMTTSKGNGEKCFIQREQQTSFKNPWPIHKTRKISNLI